MNPAKKTEAKIPHYVRPQRSLETTPSQSRHGACSVGSQRKHSSAWRIKFSERRRQCSPLRIMVAKQLNVVDEGRPATPG